jgi:hypothetical protein
VTEINVSEENKKKGQTSVKTNNKYTNQEIIRLSEISQVKGTNRECSQPFRKL